MARPLTIASLSAQGNAILSTRGHSVTVVHERLMM